MLVVDLLGHVTTNTILLRIDKRSLGRTSVQSKRGVGIPIWTFVRLRDQIREGDVHTVRVSGKEVKTMLWAAFRYNQRTGLTPLDRDPTAQRRGVTSSVIRALYQTFLPEIVVERGELTHDGAGPYRGYIVQDNLKGDGNSSYEMASIFS